MEQRSNGVMENPPRKEWAHIGDFSNYKIECVGCKSDGPIFEPCSFCKIKKCCELKKLSDCSYCSEIDVCEEIIRPSRNETYKRLLKIKDQRSQRDIS